MKKRPKIEVGDIVRLSKKIRAWLKTSSTALGLPPRNSTLVVEKVDGDGVEGRSLVFCRTSHGDAYTMRRSALWKTGSNINDPTEKSIAPQIKNNDGRLTCFVCEHPTITVGMNLYNICDNSECSWYKN